MTHDPVEVVRRLGGGARYADLMAWTSRRRLRDAVEAGRLVRLARSVYALPSLPPALQSAARAGAVLSHASAARQWGLPLAVEPGVVHVTVPRGSRPLREDGVQLHWATRSAEDGATSVLDTVLDCATALPLPQALAIADGALRERFLRRDVLRAAARDTHGPGRAARVRVADAADGRAENPFESVLRAVVLGLDGFEPQLEIRLPGRTVHADLADPVRRIALEADSYAFHGGGRPSPATAGGTRSSSPRAGSCSGSPGSTSCSLLSTCSTSSSPRGGSAGSGAKGARQPRLRHNPASRGSCG